MFEIKIPKELDEQLEIIVRHTGKTKDYIIEKALLQYFDARERYSRGVEDLKDTYLL